MDIITTSDLASYLRDPDASDADVVVELTNGLLTEVAGDLDPVPVRVRAIALEVAGRAWRNPEGLSSETIDDYTARRDGGTSAAGVYLTADELGVLQTLGGSRRAAYTVPIVNPIDVTT